MRRGLVFGRRRMAPTATGKGRLQDHPKALHPRNTHRGENHQDLPVRQARGHPRNRRNRAPGRRRRRCVKMRWHRRAGHRRRRQDGARRAGLLPAHRRLPGKVLRRRPHPGWLLQARRPPDREGNADLAPDRSPDPPAVPGRIQQRSPDHRDGDVDESGSRRRHPGADRRVRRARAVAARRSRARSAPPRSVTRTASTCSIPTHDANCRLRELELVVAGTVERRADGRVRSQGTVGRRDARRRDVRPSRNAEGRSTRSTSSPPKPAPSRRRGPRRPRTPR